MVTSPRSKSNIPDARCCCYSGSELKILLPSGPARLSGLRYWAKFMNQGGRGGPDGPIVSVLTGFSGGSLRGRVWVKKRGCGGVEIGELVFPCEPGPQTLVPHIGRESTKLYPLRQNATYRTGEASPSRAWRDTFRGTIPWLSKRLWNSSRENLGPNCRR